MNLYQKAKDFIFQDVKNENEVKKHAVILRINGLIMCLYFILTCGLALCGREWRVIGAAVAGIAAYSLLFFFTYYNRTKQVYLCSNLLMIGWVCFLVHAYGNAVGELGFFYMLIVLLYIADYWKMVWKIAYLLFLLVIRMWLFFYAQNHMGFYYIESWRQFTQYTVNVTAICTLLLTTVSIATSDSREMEKKLISYNNKLSKLARLDALTGLFNRRATKEYINRKVIEYESGNIHALSVAIGDIDFFKRINDTYGHQCGDKVLRKLSSTFAAFMRGRGHVGRWGGEEFLFVFKNYNGDEAGAALADLQTIVRELDFIAPSGEKIKLTMTFGLSEYDSRAGVDGVVEEADEKLYMGKERGRNTIVY